MRESQLERDCGPPVHVGLVGCRPRTGAADTFRKRSCHARVTSLPRPPSAIVSLMGVRTLRAAMAHIGAGMLLPASDPTTVGVQPARGRTRSIEAVRHSDRALRLRHRFRAGSRVPSVIMIHCLPLASATGAAIEDVRR